MLKKITISLFIITTHLIGVSSCFAQETLTWQDCLQEAKINNPNYLSALENVEQAKADKKLAVSNFLPQITAGVTGRTSKSGSGSATDAYSYGLSGRQLIFDSFKTSSDIKASRYNLTAEEYNYAIVSSNIRLNLKTAFSSLLRAQALVSLTEDIASRRKQNLEMIELRYEAGREHKGAFLTAQADLAEADFEVSQAKRNLSLTQRELLLEMGREDIALIEVSGKFTIKEANRAKPNFYYLAQATPLINELIARKEAVRYNLVSSKSELFPAVYLSGSLGQSDDSWPPKEDNWSAGLAISFPIFEGGSNYTQIAKTESRLRQAEFDERSGRDNVILTLEETWKNLQDTIDNVSVQKMFLDAAQERAKIAQAQYSNGIIDFDDWIIIEDNLVSAKKAHLNVQANLLIAEANWIQAKGGTLSYD